MSEYFITFIASFLIWIMFGGLVILWVIDGKIKKELALHVFTSSVLTWVIAEMIKNLHPVFRPYQIYLKEALTVTNPTDGSFPSVHAAVAFALATSMWMHNKRIGAFYIFFAVVVALGRVLSNVHFPFDIMIGSIIGISVSLFVGNIHLFSLLKKLKFKA